MRKGLFLLLILLASFLSFIPLAQAQGENQLELWVNEPYFYVKGDTMQIKAFANSSVNVLLRVYWNWKTFSENDLIYSDVQLANATWNLPTSGQRPGFYKITITDGETTVTTWRTLIHYTSYSPASLPFSQVWKNVNYTLKGRTVRAERENDYLEITYPKIPFEHSTDFYVNNMTFLIRLTGATWAVDLCYMVMHSSVKWTINGSLMNPQSFEFECSHNPLMTWRKRLNRFESAAFLVFDWEDLQRAGKAFSWNQSSKTLSVDIPSSFSIDPAIFEDGFESGDFTAWSNTVNNPSIVGSPVHHGSYAMRVNLTTAGTSREAYRDEAGISDHWGRIYIQFNATPAAGQIIEFLTIRNTGDSRNLGIVRLRNDGGTLKWTLVRRANGSWAESYSAQQTNPSVNTWYALELLVNCSSADNVNDGGYMVWVDGSELTDIRQVNIDTDSTTSNRFRVYTYTSANLQINGTIDCCVFDDAYIGLDGGVAYDRDLTLTVEAAINLDATVNYVRAPIQNLVFTITNDRTVSYGRALTVDVEVLINLLSRLPTDFYRSLSVDIVLAVTLEEVLEALAELDILENLMFGSGAWLAFIVIICLILLVGFKIKYSSAVFVPTSIYLAILYWDNVAADNNFIIASSLLLFAVIPLLIFMEYKRK